MNAHNQLIRWWGGAVLRLLPSEGFFSVLIIGIHLQAHRNIADRGSIVCFIDLRSYLITRLNDRLF